MDKMDGFFRNKYGLEVVEQNLIQQVEEEIYRLKDRFGNKFKFKVFKNLTENREKELKQIDQWISHLSNQLPIPLPQMIKSKDGNYFLPVRDAKGCLVEWIDWKIIDKFDVSNAFKIGKRLRVVHEVTKNYKGQMQAVKKINSDWIHQSAKQSILQANQTIEPQSTQQLEHNLNNLAQWLFEKEQSEPFGLIHSDLHRKNIIFKGENLGFIDFDDAVYSAYLLDLATILNEFADFPDDFEALQAALLIGYGLETNKQLAEDLYYFRKVADLIYADWIFGYRASGVQLSSSKNIYGTQAITSLIQMKAIIPKF
ncbi:MAG: hypothetical protein Sapg2KO_49070 [Saprospiraceae bacterium]